MVLCFHKPHPQPHHHDLSCWLYAKQLSQSPNVHTKRQSRPAIWSLIIGSFSMSWSNFSISLILTHREIPVECRLMTCLPKALPVYSPLSFSSHCLHSTYYLLIISSLAWSTLSSVHLCPNLPLSTLSCVHLCPNLPLSMRLFSFFMLLNAFFWCINSISEIVIIV